MTYITPPEEAERLAAVRRYDILDTPPDGAFDRITRMAARMFGVPISIVSIVDEDRIWFKSHHGIDASEIPRGPGLCASAILDSKPWVLTDAKVDPRSLANPLVAGEFGLRFYAGVPLRTYDGHSLGTLCVIDREPRDVSEYELAQLSDLAAVVMDELELRLSAKRAVAEKEILFKEVHHRVKNNLQIVSSLLALQSRSAPAELKVYFDESLRRIQSMGLLHEKFYQERQVARIDLLSYLGELGETIIDSFGLLGRVKVKTEGQPIQVGLDTGTTLALLAAEVISNACKYAFPGEMAGEITIALSSAQEHVLLRICDNGIGLTSSSENKGTGMGQRLISNFVDQLRGSSRFLVEQGTSFELTFPHGTDRV
ncbi:sensor histidine kinase [Microvirga sp. GCM10011540]|uniref:sensor histidine kinase n=1 Tax=Microvirga sp. GCM10011540 TaxID=3317338 RepID=UPI00360B51CC